MAAAAADEPLLAFAAPADWRAWLQAHGAQAGGVWLRIAKPAAGEASVSYAEALDEALCFGWVDGVKGAIDAHWWRQRFTPRRPRSRWSKINVGKAETLIAAGRMAPPGLAQVEAARADGRWAAAYAGARSITVPEDLAAALAAAPEAEAAFATLDGANRYAILYRVGDAKRPETRARRIAQFVDMLSRGERIHPARKAVA